MEHLRQSSLIRMINENRGMSIVVVSAACHVAVNLFQRYNDKVVLLPRRRFIANAKCARFLDLFEAAALREAQRMDKAPFASGSDDCDNLKTIDLHRAMLLFRATQAFDADPDLRFRLVQVLRVFATLQIRSSILRPANLPPSYANPLAIIARSFPELVDALSSATFVESKEILTLRERSPYFAARASDDAIIERVFASALDAHKKFVAMTRQWARRTIIDKNRGRIGNFWRSKRRHFTYACCIAVTVFSAAYDAIVNAVLFENVGGGLSSSNTPMSDGSILQRVSDSPMLQAILIVASAILRPIKMYAAARASSIVSYEMKYELSIRAATVDTAIIESSGGFYQLNHEIRRCAEASNEVVEVWKKGAKLAVWVGMAGSALLRGHGRLFAFAVVSAYFSEELFESSTLLAWISGVPKAIRGMRQWELNDLHRNADEAVLPSSSTKIGVQMLLEASATAARRNSAKPSATAFLLAPTMGDPDSTLGLNYKAIADLVAATSRCRGASRVASQHLAFVASTLRSFVRDGDSKSPNNGTSSGGGASVGAIAQSIANAPDLNRIAVKHLDEEEWAILRAARGILPRRDFHEMLTSEWSLSFLRENGIEAPTMYIALLNQRDVDRRGLVKQLVERIKEESLPMMIVRVARRFLKLLALYHLSRLALLSTNRSGGGALTSSEIDAAMDTNFAWISVYESATSAVLNDVLGMSYFSYRHAHSSYRMLWRFRYLLDSLPITIDDCFAPPLDDAQFVKYRDLATRELRTAPIGEVLRDRKRDRKGRIYEHKLQHEIEFLDVSFAYPKTVALGALNKCSFVIKARGFTGILGPSGGGKSTIFKLLTRLYDPFAPLRDDGAVEDAGLILIDGIPHYLYTAKCVRSMFTVVSQQVSFDSSSATVAQAIAFNAPVTLQDVMDACRKARCHDFIMKKENQYDTMGRAAKFSGGEMQRMAIARALVRKPEALLLDESTSALDAVTEVELQKAFEELAREKTVIAIAHRLSTLKAANWLIVIKDGRCVQQGTHDELIADDSDANIYKQYLREQSLGTHAKKRRRGRQQREAREVREVEMQEEQEAEPAATAAAESSGSDADEGTPAAGESESQATPSVAVDSPLQSASTAELMLRLAQQSREIAQRPGVDSYFAETLSYHADVVEGICKPAA